MAMYVWDRFTMSLVLMYRKPTYGQTEGLVQGSDRALSTSTSRGHLIHY